MQLLNAAEKVRNSWSRDVKTKEESNALSAKKTREKNECWKTRQRRD